MFSFLLALAMSQAFAMDSRPSATAVETILYHFQNGRTLKYVYNPAESAVVVSITTSSLKSHPQTFFYEELKSKILMAETTEAANLKVKESKWYLRHRKYKRVATYFLTKAHGLNVVFEDGVMPVPVPDAIFKTISDEQFNFSFQSAYIGKDIWAFFIINRSDANNRRVIAINRLGESRSFDLQFNSGALPDEIFIEPYTASNGSIRLDFVGAQTHHKGMVLGDIHWQNPVPTNLDTTTNSPFEDVDPTEIFLTARAGTPYVLVEIQGVEARYHLRGPKIPDDQVVVIEEKDGVFVEVNCEKLIKK
jgi:hypothetical protein